MSPPEESNLQVGLSAQKQLAVDLLVSADQRRPISVADHESFRESITPARPFDEIDELVAEIRSAQLESEVYQ